MKGNANQSDQESRSNAEQISPKGTIGYRSVLPPIVQRAAEKHVAITMKKQEKHNWCWAAVCEPFTGKTQRQLADAHTPGWKENGPGKREDPCDVLENEGKNVDVTATNALDWDTMVGLIDGDKTPICMVGVHFVVICGYKGNGGKVEDRRYFYKDPGDGDKEQVATEDQINQMEGGLKGYYVVT